MMADLDFDDEVIIFGSGFLGDRLHQQWGSRVVKHQEVDIANRQAVEEYLDRTNPKVIVNAVGRTGGPGETGVDWCEANENNKNDSVASNIIGPENLGIAAAKRGILLVHLGSGCIYEGDNGGRGYGEPDKPNFGDKQFYAWSKIQAEKRLRDTNGLRFLNLRIRMPIDNQPHPRNLIDKLAKYHRVIDVQNSMTTVPDIIRWMKVMTERADAKDLELGVYNFVNPGTISAAEIMKMYQEIVDPDHKFEILPLKGLARIVKTGRSNCRLSTDKLEKQGIRLPEIHGAVESCLRNYRKMLGR